MVSCENCKKKITDREDANVLAFLSVVPRVFCNSCYAAGERGLGRHLLYRPKHPINSKLYIVGLWIATAVLSVIGFIIVSPVFLEPVTNGSGPDKGPFWVLLPVAILIWYWILYFLAMRKISELN